MDVQIRTCDGLLAPYTTRLARHGTRRLTAADVATLTATVSPRTQAAESSSLTVIVSGDERIIMTDFGHMSSS